MSKKITVILLNIILLTSFAVAKTQKEEYENDYLYSEAYFDYLIECAQDDLNKQKELEKEQKNNEEIELDKILSEEENDVVVENLEPFKLRVEESTKISPYSETFKKVNSKTIVPIGGNFSFIQNMTKSRNKYNSNDYRITAGLEFSPLNFFTLSSGLETNFSGLDQNPTSRKIYLSPSFSLNDKISLTFHNKMNVQSYSTDHDIGLTVSPFKSKVMDFGIYSGLTRKQSGAHSESINFSTNFYF